MAERHPRTAGQQAAHLIRQRILSGALAPGATLNQNELATALGMSRIPVRDALRTLAAEGLVRMRAHSTASVAPLGLDDLQELYEIRLALEPVLCRAAVPHLGAEDLEEMERLLGVMEQAASSEEWLAANNRFHGALYRRAGRPRLREIVERARLATERYTRIYQRMAVTTVDSEHRLIYDAAATGQIRRLEALTIAHLSDGFETMYAYLAGLESVRPQETNHTDSSRVGAPTDEERGRHR